MTFGKRHSLFRGPQVVRRNVTFGAETNMSQFEELNSPTRGVVIDTACTAHRTAVCLLVSTSANAVGRKSGD